MKEERRRAILELVRERPVHTQQELAAALAARGLAATQATVSRDLQELGVVRSGGGYRADTSTILSELVLSIAEVEFMVVVRTPPGTASLVARALDEAALGGVAGSLAGDDTILVVLSDRGAAAAVRRFLNG